MYNDIAPNINNHIGIGCYQLIDISIGNNYTTARPIAWDRDDYFGNGNDSKGIPIIAVRYVTTCPGCGQGLEFNRNDILVKNDVNCIGCAICRITVAPAIPKSTSAILAELPPAHKDDDDIPLPPAPSAVFKDPVLEGLLEVELDLDLQVLIDANPEFR